jgi:hypothetical protein
MAGRKFMIGKSCRATLLFSMIIFVTLLLPEVTQAKFFRANFSAYEVRRVCRDGIELAVVADLDPISEDNPIERTFELWATVGLTSTVIPTTTIELDYRSGGLFPGGVYAYDPVTGQTFYYNARTERTFSWDLAAGVEVRLDFEYLGTSSENSNVAIPQPVYVMTENCSLDVAPIRATVCSPSLNLGIPHRAKAAVPVG